MLALDSRYEELALSIGEQIRRAAVSVFEAQQVRGNELRVSEVSPPKYLASFRVDFHRLRKMVRVANVDPGWALVEYGSHPGGHSARVPAYKPLTRGFLFVAARK